MWCWLLRLSTLSRYRWWSTLLLSLLAGALALSWAPSLIWVAAWLIVVIAARGLWTQGEDPEARGMIGPTAIPFALVLAPIAAVVLPTVFFLAIGIPTDGVASAWHTYLMNSLAADWPPILFEGTLYNVERPPLTTGAVWAAIEFPPEVVLGAVAALILPATERFGIFVERPASTEGFELPRSFSILTLVFVLGLPWALRTREIGSVPILLMAAPVLALLAGSILATLTRMVIEQLEDREVGPKGRRAALVGLLGFFLLPGLVSTVIVHPFHGSYYNLFAGGLDGAVESGHPASRDDVLPIEVAKSVAARAGAKNLYAGKWRRHFEAYVSAGYLEPLNLADTPNDWEVRFHVREAEPKKLEAEPAKRVTWGPRDAAVFVLDFRE